MQKIMKSLNSRFTNAILHSFSRISITQIPMLNEFLSSSSQNSDKTLNLNSLNSLQNNNSSQNPNKTFYIETYGCQMNSNDSEIVNSILQSAGYILTPSLPSADIVLMNTCAVREGAETRIWGRLSELRRYKSPTNKPLIIGVLGCMAERLKEKLLEKAKIVDLIAGPDAYRDLPTLLMALEGSKTSMNVQLSADETYGDIRPIRFKDDATGAYVSIMRGCNNMCSFCIVPFTRGRERSRDFESILEEIKGLRDQGIKEITLLGQNVNSYHDKREESSVNIPHVNTAGFGETYKLRSGEGLRFENLLRDAAEIAPEVRFRFTSPHPKNFPKGLLDIIASFPNICKSIHLPAQSGSSSVLSRMRRNYTREAYLNLISSVRSLIPDVSLSTDMITGFCGETEEEFKESIDLLEAVQYDQAFLFAYSMREKTHAHRNYKDDVPEEIKLRRLQEMIEVYMKNLEIITRKELGRMHLVLIEGFSGGKYPGQLKGRTDTNKRVLIQQKNIREISDKKEVYKTLNGEFLKEINDKNHEIKVGDYVLARIGDCTKKSLFGEAVGKMSLKGFWDFSGGKAFIEKEKVEEAMK